METQKKKNIILIEHLNKAFEERILFQDYNLNVEDGDYVSITGPSGCGKTTLLNMIGALEPLDSGRIVVNGKDISNRKNRLAYYSDIVGFLFQNFVLIENKTVEQNLELIKAENRSGITIQQALSAVGLPDKRDSKVYTLSGGEQQRVALARLLIKKCKVILADEPTGSLDKKNADIVMYLLEKLNAMGKTVLLVSHDPEVIKWGNRLLRLSAI